MTKKHLPSVSYQDDLLEDLKNHDEAIAYLYPNKLKNRNLGTAKALGFADQKRSRICNTEPFLIDESRELWLASKSDSSICLGINAALEESQLGDEESQELFLQALRNVAEAQGGVGTVAKKSHIRREMLYRILSPQGNPELRTFTTLIHAMGLQLRFC
jgi:probable addiction module antidote protein